MSIKNELFADTLIENVVLNMSDFTGGDYPDDEIILEMQKLIKEEWIKLGYLELI
jgi:hypothetical protein